MDCPLIPIPDIEDIQFKTSWKSVAEPYLARYVEKDGKEPTYEIGCIEIMKKPSMTNGYRVGCNRDYSHQINLGMFVKVQ